MLFHSPISLGLRAGAVATLVGPRLFQILERGRGGGAEVVAA